MLGSSGFHTQSNTMELLYGVNSGLIAATLVLSMALAMEIGYRRGRSAYERGEAAAADHMLAIQASILGVLGLLLAFALSLALQRFDSRSVAVIDEANAIGTTYLRSQLLRSPMREEVRDLLRTYVNLRVAAGATTSVEGARRAELLEEAEHSQSDLWGIAVRAVEIDPGPATSALFIQALNDMIDSYGRREEALARHVPEIVLLLLYMAFLLAGGVVGRAAGLAGHRPVTVSYAMMVLIVALVFIIIDLDRPRRGVIVVSQKSLVDLAAAMQRDAVPRGGRH